ISLDTAISVGIARFWTSSCGWPKSTLSSMVPFPPNGDAAAVPLLPEFVTKILGKIFAQPVCGEAQSVAPAAKPERNNRMFIGALPNRRKVASAADPLLIRRKGLASFGQARSF